MSVLHFGTEEVIFKTFDYKNSDFYAERQAELYNFATKNLPGPNSQNATKEGILARMNLQLFDPNGIMYALVKSTGLFIAYCQSIQVTETIIRIGYPWSRPNVSDEIKTSLLNQLIAYYKRKYPTRKLEFEIYTLDSRWQKEIKWLEQKGFKFLRYWFWPIINISDISFNENDFKYNIIEAQKSDFQLIKPLFNENDDIKRFRSVDPELQESRFKVLLETSKFHVFLQINNEIVGFIAIICTQNKDEPISISSLLISKNDSEIIYAKNLLSLALNFGKQQGYKKFISWFSENSILHQCLKPYLVNEVKWYHGSFLN